MAAMSYGEMIAGLAAAGHDISRYAKHFDGTTDERGFISKSNMTIGQFADIIVEAVHAVVDPLADRVAALEAATGVTRAAVLAKPRIKVAAPTRPIVRVKAIGVAT